MRDDEDLNAYALTGFVLVLLSAVATLSAVALIGEAVIHYATWSAVVLAEAAQR
jgi:hypothetical protein